MLNVPAVPISDKDSLDINCYPYSLLQCLANGTKTRNSYEHFSDDHLLFRYSGLILSRLRKTTTAATAQYPRAIDFIMKIDYRPQHLTDIETIVSKPLIIAAA